jgi:hypothetical protein
LALAGGLMVAPIASSRHARGAATIVDVARRRICGLLSQFGTIAPGRAWRVIQLTYSKQAIFASVTLVAYLPASPEVGSLSRRAVTISVALMWGGGVIAAVNIAVHMSIWNASVDSIVHRLEGPLRRTADDISARLGYRRQGSAGHAR